MLMNVCGMKEGMPYLHIPGNQHSTMFAQYNCSVNAVEGKKKGRREGDEGISM